MSQSAILGSFKRALRCFAFVPLVLQVACIRGFSAEYHVASAGEITALNEKLKPGDVVLLKSGAWKNQVLSIHGSGTPEKPITFRAESPGKTELIGESSVSIDGENLVVSGLHLKDAQLKGDGIELAGSNNRLTDTAVTGGAFKFFVHIFGTSNRMDHCYLADKTSDSPTLAISRRPGKPNHHQIDYNHFGPRPPLGQRGSNDPRWLQRPIDEQFGHGGGT